jgi:hypothetical protein
MSTAVGVSAARTAPRTAPPLVGVVKSGSRWTLRPLSPKTLQPLPGDWSRRVGGPQVSLVRSPLGTGVVAAGRSGAVFVDSRTGRALRPAVRGDDSETGVYWFGGERFVTRGGAKVLGAVLDGGSFGAWVDYFDVTVDDGASALGAFGPTGLFTDPSGVFPCGLISGGEGIQLVHAGGRRAVNGVATKSLPQAVRAAGVYNHYAADVAHDRLYMLTDDGRIAEIDHVCGRPQIAYHQVALSGKPFQAAWAGHGQIMLSGEDGLGTIDTRTWTTHALLADVVVAEPTPYGIVVASPSAGGVSVYRPEGGRRFTVLGGMTVDYGTGTAPWSLPDRLVVSGRYLYVLAGGHRYTIDLTDGRVLGRARDDALLALPSYVPLP